MNKFSLRLFYLFFIFITIFSCAPKKKLIENKMLTPLAKGDMFWKNRDFVKACEQYKIAFNNELIPKQKKIFYFKRIVECSLSGGDLNTGFLFLNKWKANDPSYYKDWTYHDLYLKYLSLKQEYKLYESYLKKLLKENVDFYIKQKSFLVLQEFYLKRSCLDKAREVFNEFFENITQEQKTSVLKDLFNLFQKQKDVILKIDNSKLRKDILPDALLLWSKVCFLVESKKISWVDGYGILYKIISENPRLQSLLQPNFKDLVQRFGHPRIEMVLLLPFGQGYTEVSYGILRGIEAGIWEFETQGIEVHLKVINTCFSRWEDELISVGGQKIVVGGPIRLSIWNKIVNDGISDKYYFFAFRSDLPFEGIKGYRFFPSHKDQVSALIDYFKDNFNITNYAIFYPKGQYGRRLAEIFFNRLKEVGGKVQEIDWYDPLKTNTWQKRVGIFLGVDNKIFEEKDKEKIQEFVPDIDFQGVFIPDSFENARIIIPNFFYFNANNLFFLGPVLWSAAKGRLSGLDFSMFKNAYYPSPWKNDLNNDELNLLKEHEIELSKQRVDFWTCLGYDFLRFGARVEDELNEGNKDIISILNHMHFQWSMAPIYWDNNGIASQKMYILNVVKDRKMY